MSNCLIFTSCFYFAKILNPTLATVLLEEIICLFPQEKKLKNFNIGFLITPELRKLIIPNLCRYSNYNEQYLNFRKLEKLQVLVMKKTNVGLLFKNHREVV
jgi:hypothetical protein